MSVGRLILALSVAASFFIGVPAAEAQLQFSAEPRAGVSFPTGDLSSEGAEAGLTLGAEGMVTFRRNMTGYLSLNRHGFSCDSDCQANLGSSPRSTGLGLGLKYVFPSPPDALIWGRGGVLAHRLSTSQDSGDRNLGFEVGAGIDMPVGERLYLVPHLGFLSHDAGGDTRASWFSFGVGAHYHFH